MQADPCPNADSLPKYQGYEWKQSWDDASHLIAEILGQFRSLKPKRLEDARLVLLRSPQPSPCGTVRHQVHRHRGLVIRPEGRPRGQKQGGWLRAAGEESVHPHGPEASSPTRHGASLTLTPLPGSSPLQRPREYGHTGQPSLPHHTMICFSKNLKKKKKREIACWF